MGVSLKDIFKKDEEKLVKDRRNIAIRNLIIFSAVIVVLLIITIIFSIKGDDAEERRIAITRDVINIQNAISVTAESHISSSDGEDYPGENLQDQPVTLNINGVIEEYRYGYYYLSGDNLYSVERASALNLPNEHYIVNYETGDVINVNGIKYKGKRYHSISDLVAIENGNPIPSDNVIIISNASDLNKIRQYPNGYFKLSANIDMSEYTAGEGWLPIPDFDGVFDGRGYTISNLNINRPTQLNIGLFGNVKSNAKISNVTFDNVSIVGGENTGALAGYCSGTINNVHILSGNVTGYRRSTGAIAGAYGISKMSNCTVQANVDGDSEVGGVIGTLYSGVISRVSFNGKVTGTSDAGGFSGLVRVSSGATEINECMTYSSVNGKSNLGGFIGEIEMTTDNSIHIKNSYAVGSIETGEENIGGMIGYIYAAQGTPTIIFDYLYDNVNVVVKGETSGGFIGNSAVSNSTIKSTTECFWVKDIPVGEVLESTGTYTRGSEFTSVPLTKDESKMSRSYTTWDFEKIWSIKERSSTPYLKWEK